MLRPMLDWNDLRYAVTLAEAGTMRAAARRLGVDPSTVSRRLAALAAFRRERGGAEGGVPTSGRRDGNTPRPSRIDGPVRRA